MQHLTQSYVFLPKQFNELKSLNWTPHHRFLFCESLPSGLSSPIPILHLTLWMYPVTASKVYKNKLAFVMPQSNVNPHHPFAFVSLFFQGFSQSAPLKGSQITIQASLFSLENGFDAFDWGVIVRFLFTLTCWFISLLVYRASANKNIRKSWDVKNREGVWTRWEQGHDVWFVSAVKLPSPLEEWE